MHIVYNVQGFYQVLHIYIISLVTFTFRFAQLCHNDPVEMNIKKCVALIIVHSFHFGYIFCSFFIYFVFNVLFNTFIYADDDHKNNK